MLTLAEQYILEGMTKGQLTTKLDAITIEIKKTEAQIKNLEKASGRTSIIGRSIGKGTIVQKNKIFRLHSKIKRLKKKKLHLYHTYNASKQEKERTERTSTTLKIAGGAAAVAGGALAAYLLWKVYKKWKVTRDAAKDKKSKLNAQAKMDATKKKIDKIKAKK